MTKHTTGPWHCHDGERDDQFIIVCDAHGDGDHGHVVALIQPHTDELPDFMVPEARANAALIAAAPDLLAALEEIAGYPHAEHAGLTLAKCRTYARAAIAKAEKGE